MKRLLAFLACVIILSGSLFPSVYAAADILSADKDFFGTVSYTCSYDSKNDQIIISGTVQHDIMTGYSDHTISVYSIAPGSTYDEAVNSEESTPVANSAMAVKFTFHVNIKSISGRYSKYAVVFTSPEGKKILAAEPLVPSVVSEFNYNPGDRESYKGILIDSAFEMGDSGAGTVIVDVDLSTVIGDISDSILYPMNDTYIYIKKSYVSDIDKKIVTASVTGTRVYLRYLLDPADGRLSYATDENSKKYGVPNMYSVETMEMISAVSGFLADRYDGGKGKISGIILGTKVDDIESANAIGNMSAESYAKMYALYLIAVGNAVRTFDPSLDVVIPLSDVNDYSGNISTDIAVRPSQFLENIISCLENEVSGDYDCSVMIESDTVPFNISNRNLADGIDISAGTDSSRLNADNISSFISYIERLARRYDSAPTNVIYMWNVPADLDGTALCCAYSYIYYKLYAQTRISSFVVSFDSDAYDRFSGLRSVFRYIDTSSGTQYTKELTQYFGEESWKAIIGSTVDNKAVSTVLETQMTTQKPNDIIGEFQYIDFSSPSALSYMTEGQNCSSIRSDYNSSGERGICFSSSALKLGESVECIGMFVHPESYKYTPKMALTVCVVGDGKSDNALYEVCLTLGEGKDRIIACGVVKEGEKTQLVFDVSSYSTAYLASYMKVSVSCLTGSTEGSAVWLHDLTGYSAKHYSEELAVLIEEQRRQIKSSGEEDEAFGYTFIFTVIGIVFAVAAVGIGLMMVFRKDETEEDQKQEK